MKKISNRIYRVFILLILIIALIYVSNITNLPENIILFEGEKLNLKTILGVDIHTAFSSNPNIERIENNETITVSANAVDTDYTGNLNLEVSLLGFTEVVPLGNLIGVKLYTNGVLVVGMSEITGNDMERYKPYEGSGIVEGDIIIEVDKKAVTCTSELTECINKSKGQNVDITYIRDGETNNTKIKPVKASDNTYKVGLWVRDTAAGVRYSYIL